MPIGIIVNCSSIIAGGLVGAILGKKIPAKIKTTLPLMFGYASIAMGVFLIMKMESLTIVVLSLLTGVCIGELLDIEHHLHSGINKLGKKIDIFNHNDEQREHYITLFSIFVAGGTGIFGALMEGIAGDSTILLTKATLDFFTALIFASSIGFSILTLGIFQGIFFIALFFSAQFISPFLTESAINNFRAMGGLISLIIGFKIANIKHAKVTNLFPALVLVVVLSRFITI